MDTKNYGFSCTMGPKLRKLVEQQLLEDFKSYYICDGDIVIDWSDSCVEGKSGVWLDGRLDRYSGITLLNKDGDTIAEGWMEFILDHDHRFFKVYWEYIELVNGNDIIGLKDTSGLPEHIRKSLPDYILNNLEKYNI